MIWCFLEIKSNHAKPSSSDKQLDLVAGSSTPLTPQLSGFCLPIAPQKLLLAWSPLTTQLPNSQTTFSSYPDLCGPRHLFTSSFLKTALPTFLPSFRWRAPLPLLES